MTTIGSTSSQGIAADTTALKEGLDRAAEQLEAFRRSQDIALLRTDEKLVDDVCREYGIPRRMIEQWPATTRP